MINQSNSFANNQIIIPSNTQMNNETRPKDLITAEEYRSDLSDRLSQELSHFRSFGKCDIKWFIENKFKCPILYQLYIGMQLIYPTSVKCETSFSFMKIIKNQQRNRLSADSLDSILRIKYSSREDVIDCINNIVHNKTMEKRKKQQK